MKFPINESIESFLGSLDISLDELKFEGDLSSMSNSNYLFSTDKSYKKLVVRVDNASNSAIIDRGVERLNSKVVESLGIGPRILFSDGYKISEYITGACIYDKTNPAHLAALCKSLATLHRSTEVFQNRFDPIKMGYDYLNGIEQLYSEEAELAAPSNKPVVIASNNSLQLSRRLRDELKELCFEFDVTAPSELLMVPCQVDLVPENLLYSDYDGKLYIIDQEYSGMFYLEWDLAELASETAMTDSEESHLLESYEKASGYSVDRRLYYLCKAACNLLWSAWAVYFHETKSDMRDYFNLRYGNYITALNQYKEMKGQ